MRATGTMVNEGGHVKIVCSASVDDEVRLDANAKPSIGAQASMNHDLPIATDTLGRAKRRPSREPWPPTACEVRPCVSLTRGVVQRSSVFGRPRGSNERA